MRYYMIPKILVSFLHLTLDDNIITVIPSEIGMTPTLQDLILGKSLWCFKKYVILNIFHMPNDSKYDSSILLCKITI